MKKNLQIKNIASQIFFILFLCIIAFRLSFMENISIDSFNLKGVFYDNFLSILISCTLLSASAVWITILLRSRKYNYKYTGLEIGAFLFIIAAAVSTYFASNKRASLNDAITILAIIVSAIVLVQLLDSEIKQKILLFFIIAMAVVNIYQCSDQFFSGNKIMIEEYKTNPKQQLEQLGIESGSFQQMLYEHRLYSKDVKGFFTTSNSAGSFFNLAIFAAIAVFGSGLKHSIKKTPATLVLPIVILLILFTGLVLTASKGAFAAFFAAGFLLLCVYIFGGLLKRHKIAVCIAATAGFITVILFMISYGLKHNTLPGGNSMLVRWQYWTAAAEMITDHFFTGVGGNNFSSYYTHYKIPQSLETVRDPHCFVLTILSNYGIIGLAGFCCCLFVPIIRAMKNSTPDNTTEKNSISKAVIFYSIPAIILLILLRPIAIRSELGSRIDVMIYIIGMLYIAPVFLFGATLWLCARSKKCCENFSIQTTPLLCGVFAVLFHNLIDFGIFEPGILMTLFAIIALIASQYPNPHIVLWKKSYGYLSTVLTIAVVIVCMTLYILPVGKTAIKAETAKKLSYYGYLDDATEILTAASNDDTLNPVSLSIKGMMETYYYQLNPTENKNQLLQAEKAYKAAIARDPADFKNFENLAKVYQSLAEANPNQHIMWFEKALDSLHQAIGCYPASGELHLTAATVAQQLNKTEIAIEHYMEAIAIEDAYREEFKIMYPETEIFSRLGEINYSFAKERLEQLKANTENKNQ